MSTIEAVVKFFGAYPAWAKVAMLAGIVMTFGVAILSPRSSIDADAQSASDGPKGAKPQTALLKIHGVDSLTLPSGSMIRVTAIVNGNAFTYPSLAGVDWLVVGPTMSSQTFSLPNAQRYELRFEMHLKTSGASPARRYVSQETARVSSIPHTSEYRVFPVKVEGESVSRGASPGATIRYSIETAQ